MASFTAGSLCRSSLLENRVTPTVIRNLIVGIWVTAGVMSMPGYLGFVWPDPASCIATQWPKYEAAMEVSLYIVSCTLVVIVYIRIWNEVMHSEMQHQQQQPNWAAATTSRTTSQSGARGDVDHGIRMLWHHRQLIRKHRATRTTMVILVSFVCLFFPYYFTRVIIAAGVQFAELMLLVTSWIALMAFTTNAFIYAIFNHDFREAFRRILCGGASGNSVAPAGY